MKANFLLISCALVLLLVGCSKETHEIREDKAISAYDLKVGNSINSFISKLEYHKAYPDLKSLETISADSALWYLESTFNYCYGFPNEFYKSFVVDTLSFSLLLSGNDVSMTDLTDKFNEMIQDVSTTYQAVNFGEKGLSLVNLQEASVTEDLLSFTVQVVTGERGIKPPPPLLDGPFGEGDDWWYGEMKGRCDEFLGDSDAANQLKIAINAMLPDPEGNFYVINPVEITKKGGDSDLRRPNDIEDNVYDYYLFYGNEDIGNVGLCLNRNIMNWYYSSLEYLLFTKIKDEELSPSYSLISILYLTGDKIDVDDNGSVEYYHIGNFKYGMKVNYITVDFPQELQ